MEDAPILDITLEIYSFLFIINLYYVVNQKRIIYQSSLLSLFTTIY